MFGSRTVWFRILVGVVCVALVGTGCGEGDAVCSVELEENSAEPTDDIAMSVEFDDEDFEADVEKFHAKAHPGEGAAYPVGVQHDADDNLNIVTPVHPDGIEGGEVDLQVMHGEEACEQTTLEIEPLERKPGATEALVERVSVLLETEVEPFGFDSESLVDAYDAESDRLQSNLPINAVPGVQAQYLLDHPDNSMSLQKLVEGSPDTFETMFGKEADYDLELADALIAKVDFEQIVDERIAELEEEDIPEYEWTQGSESELERVGLTDGFMKPEINSVHTLSSRMREAGAACDFLDDPGAFEDLTTVIGVVGSVPHALTKAGAAVLSLVETIIIEITRMRCELNPSELFRFEPPGDRIELEEDRERVRLDEAPTTYARSKGYNLSMVLFNTLDKLTTLATTANSIAKKGWKEATDWSKKTIKEVFEEFVKSDMENTVVSEYKSIIKKLIEKYGEGRLPPLQWGEYELDSTEWVGIYSPNTIVNLQDCGSDLCVLPANVGRDVGIFYASDSRFPPLGAKEPIENHVKTIQIAVPRRKLIEPGDEVAIDYEVKDAVDSTLEWDTTSGVGKPEDEETGYEASVAESGTVYYDTPTTDRADYPIAVQGESQADEGLRNPDLDPPARVGATILDTRDIIVSPKFACVPPGETEEFRVEVGDDARDIDWSPGDMVNSVDEETATFRAPDSKGEYTVTASVVYESEDGDRRTVEESATMKVDECKCWYSLQANGGLVSRGSKMQLYPARVIEEDGQEVGAMWALGGGGSVEQDGHEDLLTFFVGVPGDPEAGRRIGVNYDATGSASSSENIQQFGGEVKYSEGEERYVEGVLWGQGTDANMKTTAYSMQFRAGTYSEEYIPKAVENVRKLQDENDQLDPEAAVINQDKLGDCGGEESGGGDLGDLDDLEDMSPY